MANPQEIFKSYTEKYQKITDEGENHPDYFKTAWKIALCEIPISELCDEFAITEGTISRYIRGKSQPMKYSKSGMLERLAKMLESKYIS